MHTYPPTHKLSGHISFARPIHIFFSSFFLSSICQPPVSRRPVTDKNVYVYTKPADPQQTRIYLNVCVRERVRLCAYTCDYVCVCVCVAVGVCVYNMVARESTVQESTVVDGWGRGGIDSRRPAGVVSGRVPGETAVPVSPRTKRFSCQRSPLTAHLKDNGTSGSERG